MSSPQEECCIERGASASSAVALAVAGSHDETAATTTTTTGTTAATATNDKDAKDDDDSNDENAGSGGGGGGDSSNKDDNTNELKRSEHPEEAPRGEEETNEERGGRGGGDGTTTSTSTSTSKPNGSEPKSEGGDGGAVDDDKTTEAAAAMTTTTGEPSNSTTTTTAMPTAAAPTEATATIKLSKNQMKKRRRLERMMEVKRRRKEQEREVKIARALAQGRDLEAERRELLERTESGEGRERRRAAWERKYRSAERSFRVCLDCSYESSMTSKEIGSLALQIRYCYASNKRSPRPCPLAATSVDGETLRHLQNVSGFDEWSNRAFTCTKRSLEEYYGTDNNDTQNDGEKIKDECKNDVQGEPESNDGGSSRSQSPRQQKQSSSSSSTAAAEVVVGGGDGPLSNVVYLTSDSDDVLDDLDDTKIYVIGGIVDRNRLKRAAYDRAKALGVSTARLPVGEYLREMRTTRVLACNHVFDLLLRCRENGGNWRNALRDVLPPRKEAKFVDDDDHDDNDNEDGPRR